MRSLFALLFSVLLAAATQGQTFTTEQQRVIDATPARLAAVLREEMSWTRMRPLYAQIYRESFTQQEVDGLAAFYRSPIGVAYIDKMPVVMRKSMALIQERMGPMVDKINGVIEQAVREAKGVH